MENKEYSQLVGFSKAKIIKISPDLEWVQENYDPDAEKKEYFFTKKNQNRVAILDFYLESPKGDVFLSSIWLEEEEIQYKSGTYHFINQSGFSQICQNKSQLFNNFTHFTKQEWVNGKLENEELLLPKVYRKAVKGEDLLINILKHFVNPKSVDESCLLELDEIFKGNLEQIENLIFNDEDFHFIQLLYVTPELQQKVWNEYLPLKMMSEINNNAISKYNKSTYDKFVKNLEYMKGYTHLGRMRNLLSSDIPEEKEINENDDSY